MRLFRSVIRTAPAPALVAVALLVAIAAPARDQTATAASTETSTPPCHAPEHRQFDFWIGDWDVVSAEGETAGRNRITSDFGGCVLREQWTGAKGLTGSSFNIFDARTGRWHQTWVDGSGLLLLLDGGLREDGAMVFQGEHPDSQGGTVRHRITWTPTGRGALRQLWEVTSDGGSTWRVLFDGRYRRAR